HRHRLFTRPAARTGGPRPGRPAGGPVSPPAQKTPAARTISPRSMRGSAGVAAGGGAGGPTVRRRHTGGSDAPVLDPHHAPQAPPIPQASTREPQTPLRQGAAPGPGRRSETGRHRETKPPASRPPG